MVTLKAELIGTEGGGVEPVTFLKAGLSPAKWAFTRGGGNNVVGRNYFLTAQVKNFILDQEIYFTRFNTKIFFYL